MIDEPARKTPRGRLHRGPSIADVASRAGVAPMTASRVANGGANVDPAKRDRVLAAMKELNYQPNRMARALRSGEFRNIGVIVFDLNTFGNMRTLRAISAAAASANYSVTLVSVAHPTQNEVTDAFARMQAEVVDGVIIVIDQNFLDRSAVQLPEDRPVVVVDSDPRLDYPVVDTDQRQGARLATEHLLSIGHETVWHIAGPPTSYAAIHREEGWRLALEAAGRATPEVLYGDWTPLSGYHAGLELAKNADVTAVFVANDQMALGLLRAFHETGILVPDGVSVVGFDNTPETEVYWPPLTTVAQNFDRVGASAFDKLIARIRGEEVEPMSKVSTTLVLRSSTMPRAKG